MANELRKLGRDGWLFDVPVDSVRTACKNRIQFHTERLAYWKDQRAQGLDKVRAQGIIFDDDESYDALTQKVANSYQQRGVRMDPELQAALNHADSKVKEHEARVRDYSAWARTLAVVSDSGPLRLRHADMLYFDVRPA